MNENKSELGTCLLYEDNYSLAGAGPNEAEPE